MFIHSKIFQLNFLLISYLKSWNWQHNPVRTIDVARRPKIRRNKAYFHKTTDDIFRPNSDVLPISVFKIWKYEWFTISVTFKGLYVSKCMRHAVCSKKNLFGNVEKFSLLNARKKMNKSEIRIKMNYKKMSWADLFCLFEFFFYYLKTNQSEKNFIKNASMPSIENSGPIPTVP